VIALDLNQDFWERINDSNLSLSYEKYFIATGVGQYVMLYSINDATKFRATTESTRLVDFLVDGDATADLNPVKEIFEREVAPMLQDLQAPRKDIKFEDGTVDGAG